MKDRTMTYFSMRVEGDDNSTLLELCPMTDRERAKLTDMILKYGLQCSERRVKEADRRLAKAAKLESEAAALRGDSAATN